MADELARGGQGVEDLGVDAAGDGRGGEGAVDGVQVGEVVGGAFGEEIRAVGGGGRYDFGVLGEGFPVVVGAGRVGELSKQGEVV